MARANTWVCVCGRAIAPADRVRYLSRGKASQVRYLCRTCHEAGLAKKGWVLDEEVGHG